MEKFQDKLLDIQYIPFTYKYCPGSLSEIIGKRKYNFIGNKKIIIHLQGFLKDENVPNIILFVIINII
jgi:hypothetical protein